MIKKNSVMCLGVWLSVQSSERFGAEAACFDRAVVFSPRYQFKQAQGSTEQRREVTVFSRSGSLCLVMPSVQPSGFSAGTFKAANVLAIKIELNKRFQAASQTGAEEFCAQDTC